MYTATTLQQHNATHGNIPIIPSQLHCRHKHILLDHFLMSLIYCNSLATTYCNTLQHTTDLSSNACGCSQIVLIHSNVTKILQQHCNNTLQYTATHCNTGLFSAQLCTDIDTWSRLIRMSLIYCNNTLQQHTATHCNTLQHTATYNSSQLNCMWIQTHGPDLFECH